jgi:hypothetical protein
MAHEKEDFNNQNKSYHDFKKKNSYGNFQIKKFNDYGWRKNKFDNY